MVPVQTSTKQQCPIKTKQKYNINHFIRNILFCFKQDFIKKNVLNTNDCYLSKYTIQKIMNNKIYQEHRTHLRKN